MHLKIDVNYNYLIHKMALSFVYLALLICKLSPLILNLKLLQIFKSSLLKVNEKLSTFIFNFCLVKVILELLFFISIEFLAIFISDVVFTDNSIFLFLKHHYQQLLHRKSN